MHSFPKFILVGAVAVTLAGCDDTFDPFRESDVLYSVYGHLDVAADTQRIRVSPIRRPLYTVSPDPVDAMVVIEELESGRMIQFVPATVGRLAANFGETLYATNFITTEVIRPRSTYRISIRRSDGAEASAVVRTPADFSDSTVVVRGRVDRSRPQFPLWNRFVAFHSGSDEHIALLNILRYPPDAIGDPPVPSSFCREKYLPLVFPAASSLRFVESLGDGDIELWEFENGIEIAAAVRDGEDPWGLGGIFAPPCEIARGEADFQIVRSGDAWSPDTTTVGMTIHASSNLDRGAGFIAGVATQTVPADFCEPVGAPAGEFCDQYYGPQSATLIVVSTGEVQDANERITIRRGAEVWSRTGSQYPVWDRDSEDVRFRGLLPGSYRVGLENMDICEVTLAPGEEKTITLQRGSVQPGAPLDPSRCSGT